MLSNSSKPMSLLRSNIENSFPETLHTGYNGSGLQRKTISIPARLGELNQQRLRRSHTEKPSVHPEFFQSPLMVTRTKRTTELEITEKFFGFWVITSICLAFGFSPALVTHCLRRHQEHPDLLQTVQSGERNVVVVVEKRSSRGYLRKYLFSTPLHFDWQSSSSKFILRFCVRPFCPSLSHAGLSGRVVPVPSLIDRMATVWLSPERALERKPPRRPVVNPTPGRGHKSCHSRVCAEHRDEGKIVISGSPIRNRPSFGPLAKIGPT